MDSDNEMPKPKKLKTLAFHVQSTKGNNLLHQFVLDNSDPSNSGTEYYINAVLQSMSNVPVNDLNADGYSPLHLAVLKNNLLMVKKLLFCLADIDVNVACNINPRNTALHLAAELGHLYIIQELIRERNNVRLNKRVGVNIQNRIGETALHLAAKSKHLDNLKIVEFLAHNNAHINAKSELDETPLHYACQSSSLEIVQFLVCNNADVNAKACYDATPLHYACQSSSLEIVQFLVSNNADVNAKTKYDNTTPLHYATRRGSLEIAQFLVSTNADVNAKDWYNRTPLHTAVHLGSLEIVQFLVENNSDVNAKENKHQRTPLHYAVLSRSLEIVEFLVHNNADVNIKDQYHHTPLHYAKFRNLKIVHLLGGYNAEDNLNAES